MLFRLTDFADELDPPEDQRNDLRVEKRAQVVSLARPLGRQLPADGPVQVDPPPVAQVSRNHQIAPTKATVGTKQAPVRLQDLPQDYSSPSDVTTKNTSLPSVNGYFKQIVGSKLSGKVALICGFALGVCMLIMVLHLSHRVSELQRTVTLLMLVRR